ncbi:MAG TPA: ABC transporter permease [Candidatus Dormibacteraeota bacterium]
MAAPPSILELDNRPQSWGSLLRELWRYRDVAYELSRTDFRARYKQASFGILWALAVPLLQAAVIAVVFARIAHLGGRDFNYPVYVISGVLAWNYFAMTFGTASAAIVDGADLTGKVWFPRLILPAIPTATNAVGFLASIVALVIITPLLGVGLGPQLLWLLPACALVLLFTLSLSALIAVLHVYLRDLRYMVQAGLLVWFYATPIIYPARVVHLPGGLFDFNPVTGMVDLFRLATLGPAATQAAMGGEGDITRAVIVSVVTVVVITALALELYRRHDRLVSDLM